MVGGKVVCSCTHRIVDVADQEARAEQMFAWARVIGQQAGMRIAEKVYSDIMSVVHPTEGWVDVFRLDANGKFMLNERRTEALRQRLYGNVTVAWKTV